MTAEQIHRELCKLDPALEPWQKCEHVYQSDHGIWTRFLHCTKCNLRTDIVPPFGDGDTLRYSTVDALLGLCERLGLDGMVGKSHKGVSTKYGASIGGLDKQLPSGAKVLAQLAWADTPVAALSEAILRAFGRWSE